MAALGLVLPAPPAWPTPAPHPDATLDCLVRLRSDVRLQAIAMLRRPEGAPAAAAAILQRCDAVRKELGKYLSHYLCLSHCLCL